MKSVHDIQLEYALDAVDILGRSARMATEYPHYYRVAALQLRLLLCDTTRLHGKIVNISLIPGLLPDLSLPGVRADGRPDASGQALNLADWLEQSPLPGVPLTIRQLVRITCDQDGGAHVDRKVESQLPEGIPDFLVNLSTWLAPHLSVQLTSNK
jgi:hypothetical protein